MRTLTSSRAALLLVLALTACNEGPHGDMLAPLSPTDDTVAALSTAAAIPASADFNTSLAELRRATARYHSLDAAIADGFVFLHACEERPGEGAVGVVYVHPERLDGTLDPSQPEGLLYEPGGDGQLKLVGAELVIPSSIWTEENPPEFLGAVFQPEEEFGVFGLHVWIWRHNPNGMFAAGNPRVNCEIDI
jgi:hypothetical protein